jgi:hypothetical protein
MHTFLNLMFLCPYSQVRKLIRRHNLDLRLSFSDFFLMSLNLFYLPKLGKGLSSALPEAKSGPPAAQHTLLLTFFHYYI